jgi:hypothetical protein
LILSSDLIPGLPLQWQTMRETHSVQTRSAKKHKILCSQKNNPRFQPAKTVFATFRSLLALFSRSAAVTIER